VILLSITIVAPHELLALIFPPRLLGASGSLAVLTAAMALLGGSFLLATYLLARGIRLTAAWLVVGTALAFTLIWTAHGAWHATAVRDLEAQLVIAAGLAGGTLAALVTRRAG
jgi:hypothetical protein